MDLKSGKLFWPRQSPVGLRTQGLRANLECDVAIVGAGLTGSMIAHSLSSLGLNVVLLDKRGVGQGSTSASTALVLYEIDTSLVELTKQRGWAAAIGCYRRCYQAIGELEQTVRKLRDTCGYRRRPSLYFASRSADLNELKKEFRARKRAGFSVEWLSPDQIEKWFSFTAPGAIYSPDAAEVDPVRLTRILTEGAIRNGSRVFTRTAVTHVRETRADAVVSTSTGYRIKCRSVVMAAGFETAAAAARRVVKLKSSYALVTRPVSSFRGWHQRCLIWETKRPYLYLRTTADRRIIIGGEDEDIVAASRRDRLINRKGTVLIDKLRRMFPEIPVEPAGCWGGTFGETKDGLPYIGQLKPRSRIHYALCYGANGTNFAVIATDIIRDAVTGKRNRFSNLFGFSR